MQKKKKKRKALSMANRASGQKRESQRGERVSNLYTVLHDGDSVCRNARVWERRGRVLHRLRAWNVS